MDAKRFEGWSLADDARFLLSVEEFSDDLTQRVSAIHKSVNQLASEASNAEASLEDINNQLLLMSNSRFVEAQVGGADSVVARVSEISENDSTVTLDDDGVLEAFNNGVNYMKRAYINVVVSETESDSDSEQLGNHVWNLEPRDPYIQYPLPYLIGSSQFQDDDYIGLRSAMFGEADQFHSDDELTDEEGDVRAASSNEKSDESIMSTGRGSIGVMTGTGVSKVKSTLDLSKPGVVEKLFDWSSGDDSETIPENSLNSGFSIKPSVNTVGSALGGAGSAAESTSTALPSPELNVGGAVANVKPSTTTLTIDESLLQVKSTSSSKVSPKPHSSTLLFSSSDEDDLFAGAKSTVPSAVCRRSSTSVIQQNSESGIQRKPNILESSSDDDLFVTEKIRQSDVCREVGNVSSRNILGVPSIPVTHAQSVNSTTTSACDTRVSSTGTEYASKSTYDSLFDSDSSDDIVDKSPISPSCRSSVDTSNVSSVPAKPPNESALSITGTIAVGLGDREQNVLCVPPTINVDRCAPVQGADMCLSNEPVVDNNVGIVQTRKSASNDDDSHCLSPDSENSVQKRRSSSRLNTLVSSIEQQLSKSRSNSVVGSMNPPIGGVSIIGVPFTHASCSDALSKAKSPEIGRDFESVDRSSSGVVSDSGNKASHVVRRSDTVGYESRSSHVVARSSDTDSARQDMTPDVLSSLTKTRVRGPSRRKPKLGMRSTYAGTIQPYVATNTSESDELKSTPMSDSGIGVRKDTGHLDRYQMSVDELSSNKTCLYSSDSDEDLFNPVNVEKERGASEGTLKENVNANKHSEHVSVIGAGSSIHGCVAKSSCEDVNVVSSCATGTSVDKYTTGKEETIESEGRSFIEGVSLPYSHNDDQTGVGSENKESASACAIIDQAKPSLLDSSNGDDFTNVAVQSTSLCRRVEGERPSVRSSAALNPGEAGNERELRDTHNLAIPKSTYEQLFDSDSSDDVENVSAVPSQVISVKNDDVHDVSVGHMHSPIGETMTYAGGTGCIEPVSQSVDVVNEAPSLIFEESSINHADSCIHSEEDTIQAGAIKSGDSVAEASSDSPSECFVQRRRMSSRLIGTASFLEKHLSKSSPISKGILTRRPVGGVAAVPVVSATSTHDFIGTDNESGSLPESNISGNAGILGSIDKSENPTDVDPDVQLRVDVDHHVIVSSPENKTVCSEPAKQHNSSGKLVSLTKHRVCGPAGRKPMRRLSSYSIIAAEATPSVVNDTSNYGISNSVHGSIPVSGVDKASLNINTASVPPTDRLPPAQSVVFSSDSDEDLFHPEIVIKKTVEKVDQQSDIAASEGCLAGCIESVESIDSTLSDTSALNLGGSTVASHYSIAELLDSSADKLNNSFDIAPNHPGTEVSSVSCTSPEVNDPRTSGQENTGDDSAEHITNSPAIVSHVFSSDSDEDLFNPEILRTPVVSQFSHEKQSSQLTCDPSLPSAVETNISDRGEYTYGNQLDGSTSSDKKDTHIQYICNDNQGFSNVGEVLPTSSNVDDCVDKNKSLATFDECSVSSGEPALESAARNIGKTQVEYVKSPIIAISDHESDEEIIRSKVAASSASTVGTSDSVDAHGESGTSAMPDESSERRKVTVFDDNTSSAYSTMSYSSNTLIAVSNIRRPDVPSTLHDESMFKDASSASRSSSSTTPTSVSTPLRNDSISTGLPVESLQNGAGVSSSSSCLQASSSGAHGDGDTAITASSNKSEQVSAGSFVDECLEHRNRHCVPASSLKLFLDDEESDLFLPKQSNTDDDDSLRRAPNQRPAPPSNRFNIHSALALEVDCLFGSVRSRSPAAPTAARSCVSSQAASRSPAGEESSEVDSSHLSSGVTSSRTKVSHDPLSDLLNE